MNKDILKGQWKQMKGQMKRRWGELTDDDVEKISGDAETLIGHVQQRYGLKREQAEQQVNEWLTKQAVSHDTSGS